MKIDGRTNNFEENSNLLVDRSKFNAAILSDNDATRTRKTKLLSLLSNAIIQRESAVRYLLFKEYERP